MNTAGLNILNPAVLFPESDALVHIIMLQLSSINHLLYCYARHK